MKAIAAALLLLCASATGAMAQAVPSQSHICTQKDLINKTWRMVLLHETPPLREAAWYRGIPYHYLSFYTENNYGYIASDHVIRTQDELRRVMQWPGIGGHTLLYALDSQGVLDLYFDKTIKYRYRCIIVDAADKNGYQKGDLLLNGFTQKNRSHLFKLYRFWF